mgnify:CR=1 FL=1|tara:strand:+ start:97 stop:450 length:354 start_codon:yes stop_codon:yes gene_type:complete
MKKLIILMAVLFTTTAQAKTFTYEELIGLVKMEKVQADKCLQYLQSNTKQEILEQGTDKFMSICMSTFESKWMEEFYFDPTNKPLAIRCDQSRECTDIIADYQWTVMKIGEHMKGGR